MAFTTPGTAVAGEVLTAAFWNEQVRDNLTQLGTGYTFVETVYFTSGGTFTKATYPWLRAIRVKCQGAGGAGGGSATTGAGQISGGGGGKSGAYAESFITDIAGLASSVTVTVGAGGVGVGGTTTPAGGGNSSFGALVIGNGASANIGASTGAQSPPAVHTAETLTLAGGTGDLVISGQNGYPFFAAVANRVVRGQGAASFLGAGGVGTRSGTGGLFNGVSGIRGGGGGGAGATENQGSTGTGGNGGDGIVIVELYA